MSFLYTRLRIFKICINDIYEFSINTVVYLIKMYGRYIYEFSIHKVVYF